MRDIKRLVSILVTIFISVIFISCGNAPKSNNTDSSYQEESSTNSDEENTEVQNNNNDDNKSKENVNGELKVHFIDVGQADSILIQQGNENMLIDAGNNEDEDTIKSYLNNLGITEFKYVVGTHAHEDHIGSLDYIMNSFKVGKIYFPKATATTKTFENLLKAVKNKVMQFTYPTVGETFNLGNAKCTILAPNSNNYEDANNDSIVIKLEYGNNSFMFTGDAEDVSEKEMLSKGFDLKADVLKVGHHGSSSSSCDEFLNAVNPKYAVISVGKDNDYGHPNKESLQRLSSRGIQIYRTDESGTIILISDGSNITFNSNPSNNSVGSSSSNSISSASDRNIINDSNNVSSSDKVQEEGTTVWVSKNGGKVYHKDRTCSGMKNPVEMTLEEAEAEAEGLRPCYKCAK